MGMAGSTDCITSAVVSVPHIVLTCISACVNFDSAFRSEQQLIFRVARYFEGAGR